MKKIYSVRNILSYTYQLLFQVLHPLDGVFGKDIALHSHHLKQNLKQINAVVPGYKSRIRQTTHTLAKV